MSGLSIDFETAETDKWKQSEKILYHQVLQILLVWFTHFTPASDLNFIPLGP